MTASPHFPDLPPHWQESIYKTAGDSLQARHWFDESKREGQVRRTLFIVHGFGENGNRYRHWPHYLDGIVSSIFALDLPGHGLSEGKRGDCESAATFHRALTRSFHDLSPLAEGSVHGLGHSFGGLLVLSLWRERLLPPMNSVIVSAPLLGLAQEPPRIKRSVGEWIEPLLGHLSLANEIDPAVLSREDSVITRYTNDPLNHDRITPRTFVEMTRLMKEVSAWEGPVDRPFSMILPLGDRLVDAGKSFRFFRGLQTTGRGKKVLHTFPGFYHESFNDKDRALPFNALGNWILQND